MKETQRGTISENSHFIWTLLGHSSRIDFSLSDCAVGKQSGEPNQTAWEPHDVTIFATESPRIRRLGANRWRIKTGLIAKSDVEFSCEILW